MDFLKRSLAPVTEKAWIEIDQHAREVLTGLLAARRVVDVSSQKGWKCDAVGQGTLTLVEESPVEGVNYGIRDVLPLLELRVPFTLPVWELDDIPRGRKTIDFSSLDAAARQAALFEDTAVFKGLEDAGILGIEMECDHEPIDFVQTNQGLIDAVFLAVRNLTARNVGGPYMLVCSKDIWTLIRTDTSAYPLRKLLKQFVDSIVLSSQYETAFVCSTRGYDAELILGQDFSIGFQSATTTDVNFYLTETFTFRVNKPEAFIELKAKKPH